MTSPNTIIADLQAEIEAAKAENIKLINALLRSNNVLRDFGNIGRFYQRIIVEENDLILAKYDIKPC